AGEIPDHDSLDANIDTDANVCTSLLVNESLNGKYLPWAVTAAFGDNLFTSAEDAATPLNLSCEQLEQLKELGTCINYNGYGASLDDLIYTPEDLYQLIKPYKDPFDFIDNEAGYKKLRDGYHYDVKHAEHIEPEHISDSHALFVLPDEKWARRVSGVFANSLAQQFPARAHAMLTEKSDGAYLVSVRAPLENKTGADELCRLFPTGGGRKAAAGINKLPADQKAAFITAFTSSFI
ncbi:MAG: DHH family phosphoesterase, partial [Deltaproteobacteria bacterium]|nr:DHH family phosphoesterase [Deltaproteobacteria bacterium]